MKKKYGYGYVFVYNPEQKEFYLDEGCQIVDSDVHITSKKPFWVFKYDDVQEVFHKWCTSNKN